MTVQNISSWISNKQQMHTEKKKTKRKRNNCNLANHEHQRKMRQCLKDICDSTTKQEVTVLKITWVSAAAF